MTASGKLEDNAFVYDRELMVNSIVLLELR